MKAASRREEKKVNEQPKGVVVALQRGLDVLACFEPHNRELSHGELSRLTQVPKPTLTRLLETLLWSGFLRLGALSEKYSLGPRLVALSSAYVNSFDMQANLRQGSKLGYFTSFNPSCTNDRLANFMAG